MTQAIGYVRRSTDRQEESLDQQRERLEAFARQRGWTLCTVYADDAISGSELSRPGLDQLFAASADPDVDVVLAWDRNRLARPKDAIDGLLLERRLQQAGKRVVYAATGQESDRSFASGLISYVEHYQNGDYLRKLSRDTMRGSVDRARRGLWAGGPIPFGYDRLILDGDTPKRIVRSLDDGGQVVMDATTGVEIDRLPKGKSHKKQDHEVCTLILSTEARVRAVQRMFADYAAGKPTRQLREDLNADGFRTSRGGRFTIPTIHPMLDSPAYIGRCVYNRRTLSKWHRYQGGTSVERQDEGVENRTADDWIVCEDAWPALVDRDTFEAVQQRRVASKSKHATHHRGNAMKSDYLLTGLMFCGVCGGKLSGTTRTSGKGIRKRYYVCSRRHAGHKEECPKSYSVLASEAGVDEDGDHCLQLGLEAEGVELFVDLGEGEEADVGGRLAVALDGGGGVAGREGDATGLDRPVEEAAGDLAVSVGGLGGEAAAADAGVDEALELGGGDVFQVGDLDDQGATSSVGSGLDGPLAGLGRGVAAGDLDLGAADAEEVAEVVDIRLSGLGRLDGADVVDVFADDLAEGRAGRQGVVGSACLAALDLAELFFGELVALGLEGLTARRAVDVDLGVVDAVAFEETGHGGPPGRGSEEVREPFGGGGCQNR